MTEIEWTDAEREAVHQRHGCVKTHDETTSSLNARAVYYCSRHHCGWLRDVDGCAHVDAALATLAPFVAAREAQAAAKAWNDGRQAGESYERDLWKWQAGGLSRAVSGLRERPERPVNPYRIERGESDG